MDEIANSRFRKIADFIHKKREAAAREMVKPVDSLTYRWQHTLRVAQYGRQLAEAEGANLELCISACLLHDLAKFESSDYGVDHGRIGAKLARPLLLELGYSLAETDNICFSIAVHVDDMADFEHPITLESKIVNDADNIDRFSAYRFLSNLGRDTPGYERLIQNAEKHLFAWLNYRKSNLMATKTGELLFNQQLDLQITLLERLIAENKLTILPEI